MLIICLILIELINGIDFKNEFIEEPKDIQTIIGSTIRFRCRTKPFFKTEITWCKNDFCTLGKTRDLPSYQRYQIIGQPDQGEHDFQIENITLEDIGFYQCQIRPQLETFPSLSRKAKLTVLQIPENVSIDNPIMIIENVESFVICRSYGGIPEPSLSWNLPKSLNSFSKKDYVVISNNFLRYSISNLTLFLNRSHHRKLIECEAHSSALQIFNKTLITQSYLEISFLPQINLNIIGEQIEDKLIVIICSIESRPHFIKIQWFNGTSLLNIRNENRLSILLNRYNHRNEITCQVNNQIGTTNQSILIDLIYKPIFIDKNGFQIPNSSIRLVDEGEQIEIECLVDSNPSSRIFWIFNQQIISINRTIIQINSFKSNQHCGIYICSAYHSKFGIFNRTITIALKGPPEIIDEKRIYSVYVGQSIRLICSISNHIQFQNIFWSRKDQILIKSNGKYQINQTKSDNLIQYQLLIDNIKLSDEDYYFCTAINQYGSSTTKFHLIVFNSKHFFIQRSFFYAFIIIITAIFIGFILLNRYVNHQNKSTSSDQSVSTLPNSQHSSSQFDEEEENSNGNYSLIIEQFNKNYQKENSSFIRNDL